jgi:hypothetical protein
MLKSRISHHVAAALMAATFSASGVAGTRPIAVPTDPSAQYTVLKVGGKHQNRSIVTKRTGPSGTSYSKRLYDCSAGNVKYLGSGDTLEEMRRSRPEPQMAPVVPRSIADYVGRAACER